jgi:hypothetical protein
MADFDPNSGSFTPQEETIGTQSMPPHLPPSNMEIRVRTMASDIESVRRGGGLLGLSEKISIAMPREGAAPDTNVPVGPFSEPKKKTGTYIILGVVGVAALFAVGYFLPLLIASNKGVPTTPIAPGGGNAATAPITPPIKTASHVSFFAIPADANFPIEISASSGIASLAEWLQSSKLAEAGLSEAPLTVSGGAIYGWDNFILALGLQTTNKNFFDSNFESDFTSYVYKDTNGAWPGFVFKLKPGLNPLLLSGETPKLEADNAFIYSIFPQLPGGAAASFTDAQISGQPVRELGFTNKPAAFVYGWVKNKYLVIGTSEAAFGVASPRL